MTDRATEPSTRPVVPGSPVGKDETSARPPLRQDVPQALPDLPKPPAGAPSPSFPSSQASSGSLAGSTTTARSRVPRRARLRLTRIDPWTVMKTSFLLSIAFAVVTVVSVAMVWQVLGAAGVWDSINSTIQEGIGGEDISSFQVQDYVGTSRVLGFTMLVAAIDVVLITAAATLTAFLYNMAAALLGGIELTLAEDSH
jgi:hypothetical protein